MNKPLRPFFTAGLFTVLLQLLFVSCNWKKSVTEYISGKTPVVEINGDVLYVEDIKQAIPLGLSVADSIVFAERYIKNWAQDVLFYQNAIIRPSLGDMKIFINNR